MSLQQQQRLWKEEEAQLMAEMDQQIFLAEQAERMQRVDASIHRRAEPQQPQQLQQPETAPYQHEPITTPPKTNNNNNNNNNNNKTASVPLSRRPPSSWLFVAEQLPLAQARRRAREETAAAKERCNHGADCYDPSSVVGLEYVTATKLIPRHLGARWKTRQQLVDYFLRKFRNEQRRQQQQQPTPLFWEGFRLRLCSANPSAWRMQVHGYRTTVDLFLQCLAGIFGKALQKQQQQQQNNNYTIQQHQAVPRERKREMEDAMET